MQWLQSVFAHKFNRLQKSPGHVFQGRYKALLVEPGPSLLRVVNYIHLNPVRVGVVTVKGLRQYRLGSFPRWFDDEPPEVLTAATWLAEAGGLKATRAGFKRYHALLELAEEGDPRRRDELYRELCRGWHIGTKAAKQTRLRALLAQPGQPAAVAANLDEPELAALLLADGLRKLGHRETELRETPKGTPWKTALGWWLRRQTGITNRWLGEHLHLGHPCAVSRLLNQSFTPELRELTRILMST